MSRPDNQDNPATVTFLSLIQSACAAFFGVQSEANRKRDFESGKFWHFIVAGIIFVLIFLGLIWLAVKLMLASAG
jgi:hypothetical protein